MTNPKDQASILRSRMENNSAYRAVSKSGPPIYAIASGKGGVGKTNVAVNLAWELSSKGSKVLLFDADFGLGNTDILLGVSPSVTLTDVLASGKSVSDIAIELSSRLTLIPAGSGSYNTANANPFVLEGFCLDAEHFSRRFDHVIVDTGAGIGERVLTVLLIADEIIVVTTPDPTSLTDSYATIKMVCQQDRTKRMRVLVNMADNRFAAEKVFKQLDYVSRKYLQVGLEYAGWIPKDKRVEEAIRKQKPVCECYPGTAASRAFEALVAQGFKGVVEPRKSKMQELIGYLFKKSETTTLESFVATV